MPRLSRESGFTLVEITIGLLLASLLAAGVFGILSVSLESRIRGDRSTELQQSARYAMDLMVREIQYAYEITTVSGDEITFKTQQFGNKIITYSRTRTTDASPWILRRRQHDLSGSQPVTGEGKSINVSIRKLEFRTLKYTDTGQPWVIGIELEVTDLSAKNNSSYTLRTAVTAMNVR